MTDLQLHYSYSPHYTRLSMQDLFAFSAQITLHTNSASSWLPPCLFWCNNTRQLVISQDFCLNSQVITEHFSVLSSVITQFIPSFEPASKPANISSTDYSYTALICNRKYVFFNQYIMMKWFYWLILP